MAAIYITEESIFHATVQEFVKLWGSDSQAYLTVQCQKGQAWIQLASCLGPPSSPHFPRHHHHHHGSRDNTHQRRKRPRQCDPPHEQSQLHPGHAPLHTRKKGPRQLERDRARAAAHRGRILDSLQAVHPQPDNLCPVDRLQQAGQVTLPRAGHPAHGAPPFQETPAHPLPPLPTDEGCSSPQLPVPPYQAHRRKGAREVERERNRAAVLHKRSIDYLDIHPQPDNLLPPPLTLPSESPAPVQQYGGEDFSSFCFLSLEPLQDPPSSSPRRPSPRLRPSKPLSEVRKPVNIVKCLLSQNIERAVNYSRGGRGGWVWDVSVRRDFEENMVIDRTSFHGFSNCEEYEEYKEVDKFGQSSKSENNSDCDDDNDSSSQVLVLSSELDRELTSQNFLDQLD